MEMQKDMDGAKKEDTLLQEQLDFFWNNGYLVIPSVFNQEEINTLAEATSAPAIKSEQDKRGATEKLVHVLEITARCKLYETLVMDRRLIAPVATLIGEDIELQHSKLTTKPTVRGRGEAPWHQDFPFFPHTNTDLVAVCVAIDEINQNNGCLKMIAGSHRQGVLDHSEDGYFSSKCHVNTIPNWEENVMSVELKPGDISIHHCLTVHGSQENNSSNTRRMLVFQYRAADAYQLSADIWQDTGLLVNGKRSCHVRCTMQSIQLSRMKNFAWKSEYGGAWNQEGGFAKAMNDRNGS